MRNPQHIIGPVNRALRTIANAAIRHHRAIAKNPNLDEFTRFRAKREAEQIFITATKAGLLEERASA